MSLPTCPHEPAVIRAVGEGGWPDGVEPALRAHVADCAVCRDTVAVATVLREADAAEDVHVPNAAQMWWRLAVRARLEREQAAARPLVWWQGVAGACGVGLALTAAGRSWPRVAGALDAVVAGAVRLVPEVGIALPPPSPLGVVAVVAGVVLVVAGVSTVLYLWIAED